MMVKDIFVIMPFSGTENVNEDEWTETFEYVFKPSIEACGYLCERAQPKTGNLIKSIIERLQSARIVLADITDHNPNVFYELGVRHSLSKRTIIVARNDAQIPSDLRGYWTIIYGIQPAQVSKFKIDLKRIIKDIEQSPDASDNPVSDFLERKNISISELVNRENIKKISALQTELSGNFIALESLCDDQESITLISTNCLDLFLQTLYIDPGPEVLRRAYELSHILRRVTLRRFENKHVNLVLKAIESLSNDFSSIRQGLCKDNFIEPSETSTMVWTHGMYSVESDLVTLSTCRSASDENSDEM